ncbi:hypothetical protein NQ317_008039 [Molorchus minor]|uniref:MMS19 nucleotide excision repair protein n=1 Tax=Molorchus minor TaxID=1323400 RepID=A0ABQ9JPX8_9CUCU|nr:hypothetical protein NQ317_008039 [Molorchus minor]
MDRRNSRHRSRYQKWGFFKIKLGLGWDGIIGVRDKAVSRDTLADALCPCLCAIPEFANYCIPLALEKLDSLLSMAKIDSLRLLKEGCNYFDASAYTKYASKIWSQIQKEIFSGADTEVKLECLSTLTIVMKKISQACDSSFRSVLSDISATVKGNFLPNSKITTSSEKKVIILNKLANFIKVYLNYHNKISFNDNEELESVYLLCLEATNEIEDDVRIAGFDSLSNLVDKLSINVRMILYERLHENLITPQENVIRIAMINCLKKFACVYQEEVKNVVLYKNKITDPIALDLYLNAFGAIAYIEYFKNVFIQTILNYTNDDIQLAIVAIKNLKISLEVKYVDSIFLKILLEEGIIPKLIDSVGAHIGTDEHTNYKLLKYFSTILKILIGTCDCETQNKIISYYLSKGNNIRERFSEMYVFLVDGLLTRSYISSFDPTIKSFLIKTSLLHKNDLVRDVAAQLLANLINKQVDDDDLNRYLDSVKEGCLQNINFNQSNVIITISWVTKALIMRNHIQANVWIELLDIENSGIHEFSSIGVNKLT